MVVAVKFSVERILCGVRESIVVGEQSGMF